MKYYISIGILLFLCSPVLGQKAKIQRANHLFEKQDYLEATLLYREIAERENSYQVKYRLALSAMKSYQYEIAAQAYASLRDFEEANQVYPYDYAQCLLALQFRFISQQRLS